MDLSIVVPVFNDEAYIRACVDSMTTHIPSNLAIEVICVDDGSTDASGAILDSLAQENDHIRVIHEDNMGVSAARNNGLSHATGTWVTFVDGDDVLAPDAFAIFAASLNVDTDIAYYGFERFTDGKPLPHMPHTPVKTVDVSDKKTEVAADFLNRFHGHVPVVPEVMTICAKIFQKKLLTSNNVSFHTDLVHGEDMIFGLEALSHASTLSYTKNPVYLYRQRLSSSTHGFAPDKLGQSSQLLAAFAAVIPQFEGGHIDWDELYEYRVLWELLYCIVAFPFHPHNPAPFSHRVCDAKKLMAEPIFEGIFTRCATTRFSFQHNVLAFLVKHRAWRILEIYRRVRSI